MVPTNNAETEREKDHSGSDSLPFLGLGLCYNPVAFTGSLNLDRSEPQGSPHQQRNRIPDMSLKVYSEIGRLRRVLLHRPGLEIDWMVPSMMERLLFDDILYGEQARSEHDRFRCLLEAAGVETLDPQELLAEHLVDAGARASLLDDVEAKQGALGELRGDLESLPAERLAASLITGIRAPEEAMGWSARNFYSLTPVPNYFFQRDPQVVLGDRVLVSAMATEARSREPLLSRALFANHPALASHAGILDLLPGEAPAEGVSLEGGDVLVASPEVVLVGLSERTNRQGVEALARYLRAEDTGFKQMVVVELPSQRSYMHLDTVFTFIDHGLCLAYMPVIAEDGAQAGRVYRIDLEAPALAYTVAESLPGVMAELGLEIELVPCGGSGSVIDQHREQWTDGANAFAIAPGVIVLYRRNRQTARELARRGWRILTEEEALKDGVDILGQGPTVLTVADNELSRARGGPRCMTMPLSRDDAGGS